MVGQIRPTAQQDRQTTHVVDKTASKRSAVRIEGSEFAGYLSKAEKRYLVEQFSEQKQALSRPNGNGGATAPGSYLDIKA
jgi:hypothetical protein